VDDPCAAADVAPRETTQIIAKKRRIEFVRSRA
jgi:hypothetical protein